MRLLLDTQLLLWAAGQPDRLSVEARDAAFSKTDMANWRSPGTTLSQS